MQKTEMVDPLEVICSVVAREILQKNHLPIDREVQQPEGHQRKAAAAVIAPHHNPRRPGGSRRAGHY